MTHPRSAPMPPPRTPPSTLPEAIAGIEIPQDAVARAAWAWARRSLPRYLLAHSVRSYCWAAAIAGHEGWTFDRGTLWPAALFHDVGLTRIASSVACFEQVGAATARRFVRRHGMPAADADRLATVVVLHMAPATSLADGVEAVLLDRATGLDVRGDGYSLADAVRPAVMRDFPRGDFDRRFLAAIRREVARRPGCQSERLLDGTGLAMAMARSPWAVAVEVPSG